VFWLLVQFSFTKNAQCISFSINYTKTNKTSNFVISQTMRLSIGGYFPTVPGLYGGA